MKASEWQERAARTEAELCDRIEALREEGLPGAAHLLRRQLERLRTLTRRDREPAEKVRPL